MPPDSTLGAIKTKVRRLTRSPSEAQISDATLTDYINTFLLYNLPDQLRLFSLRTILTFYTQPNVDTYQTNTVDNLDPLYNFKNKYLAVHDPIYLAGIQGFFTQHRDVFYGYWPQTNTVADTQLRGTGGTGPFAGNIIAAPMLQNNVIISCNDGNGTSMILVDTPINNQIGSLNVPNAPVGLGALGTINYLTGAFDCSFPANTGVAATIWAENIGYQPGKPLAVLYYDNIFTIRPVPDKTYSVQIEADIIPTELLNNTDDPFLNRAWEYIAFGTAIKIFEDRFDFESVEKLTPTFNQQEAMLLRSTLTQQANERTVTIYTQGKSYFLGWFGGSGGWPY